jgi:hypothetical protein
MKYEYRRMPVSQEQQFRTHVKSRTVREDILAIGEMRETKVNEQRKAEIAIPQVRYLLSGLG